MLGDQRWYVVRNAAELHALHRNLFDQYYLLSQTLLRSNLVLPALDYCLKCSHMFNLLDASGGIGVTERMAYILRVRQLAVAIAKRWAGVDERSVDHAGAFLSRIVTNLCLDRLGSAAARREQYVGVWLPDPLLDDEAHGEWAPNPETQAEFAQDHVGVLAQREHEDLELVRAREPGAGVDIGAATLSHLRIRKRAEEDLSLQPSGAHLIPGFSPDGGAA